MLDSMVVERTGSPNPYTRPREEKGASKAELAEWLISVPKGHYFENSNTEIVAYLPRFLPVAMACSDQAAIHSNLLSQRKTYIAARDEFLALQKRSGRSDRELARYYSDLAAEEMKLYRATCVYLGWLSYEPTPGDCKPEHRNWHSWPIDLLPYIDRVVRAAYAGCPA